MKTRIIKFIILSLLSLSLTSIQAQDKNENKAFIQFWAQFKNALKTNNADFLFKHTQVPFYTDGGYFNPEAYLEDIKTYYKEIYPPYIHEMDFVRFDVVYVESSAAAAWIGYDFMEESYFYCFKILEPGGNLQSDTYEEKYYFKKFGGIYKFFKMTAGNSGLDFEF